MEEREPKWYEGLTGYHWLVLTVAALGWAFDTMDQWLYVLARQPALMELLSAAPEDPQVAYYAGLIQAIFIFGWATGGFLFGIIGDKWGRTRTMIVTILLYAGFTGLSALAQNWQQFAVFRFFCRFRCWWRIRFWSSPCGRGFPTLCPTYGSCHHASSIRFG